MKNRDLRTCAGSFKYDDFDVCFRTSTNREVECSGVEIDFDKRRVVIKQLKKGD